MSGLMSELEAVNRILAVAGDTPVQTLEDDYVQSSLARQILAREIRDTQAIGWWYNEEQCVKLQPDIDGKIVLPVNAIAVYVNEDQGDIVQRGDTMYNRTDRTEVFTAPITVDLIIFLPWNQLPDIARQFIVAKARNTYNNEFVGINDIKQRLQQDESLSWDKLRSADVEARDTNLLRKAHVYNIAFRNRR